MGLPKTSKPYIAYTEKTVDPGNVAAASCLDVSVTWNEVLPSHFIQVQAPNLNANLGIVGCWCATAGTVIVRLMNPTAGGINDTSQTWKFLIR